MKGVRLRKGQIKGEELTTLKKLLCSDLTYAEIARAMNRKGKSLNNYAQKIYRKYEVKTRVGLVIKLLQNEIQHQRRPSLLEEQQMAKW
jgi:DNA-binding CsgD family transcriptional regulator